LDCKSERVILCVWGTQSNGRLTGRTLCGKIGRNSILGAGEENSTMKCPYCKSKHISKAGFKVLVGRKKQRLQCQECGQVFYAKEKKGGRGKE